MPRYKDELPAVRVYTVCDESKYLIVRNVPALGCGDELRQLCATYGEIEECKPMDAEECEQFCDVYWIKFRQISNARFAKRKLDESVFLGNPLQFSYAPEYESLSDTKEKLEGRRKEILARLKPGRSKGNVMQYGGAADYTCVDGASSQNFPQFGLQQGRCRKELKHPSQNQPSNFRVFSDQKNVLDDLLMSLGWSPGKDYFPSQSMNATVKLVREKLDKIESSSSTIQSGSASKKVRVDNRRRI